MRNAFLGFLMTRLSAVTPLQVAVAKAIYKIGSHLKELVSKLNERRRYSVKRLREIPHFSLSTKPRGAFLSLIHI